MHEKIKQLLEEVDLFKAENSEQLEAFRLRFLSKKGVLTELFDEFKNVANEHKKGVGQLINKLKIESQQKIDFYLTHLDKTESKDINLDLSLPCELNEIGSRHPISLVKNEIIQIFSRLGFTVAEGPEIEDDWHNFSALNFPPDHPARDMQDTFFIDKDPDIALRTHTSSVQIRVMQNQKPPIRIIAPGRVFRNEAISARAHCIFHQVEGFYLDKNVSFADLKQTLMYFARELFGQETKLRLRPSYFPFTEPSAEMDITCFICGGKGCNICKHTGWVEILGCGMIDPNVIDLCGIDSKVYTGFAFGMGIERIALLKYQVKDLRMYFENDVRFLKQFHTAF